MKGRVHRNVLPHFLFFLKHPHTRHTRHTHTHTHTHRPALAFSTCKALVAIHSKNLHRGPWYKIKKLELNYVFSLHIFFSHMCHLSLVSISSTTFAHPIQRPALSRPIPHPSPPPAPRPIAPTPTLSRPWSCPCKPHKLLMKTLGARVRN